MAALLELPQNILVYIFSILPPPNLLLCRQVCSYWAQLIDYHANQLPKLRCNRLNQCRAILSLTSQSRTSPTRHPLFGRRRNRRVLLCQLSCTNCHNWKRQWQNKDGLYASTLSHIDSRRVQISEVRPELIGAVLEELKCCTGMQKLCFSDTNLARVSGAQLGELLSAHSSTLSDLQFHYAHNCWRLINDTIICMAGKGLKRLDVWFPWETRRILGISHIKQCPLLRVTDSSLNALAAQRVPFEYVRLSLCAVTTQGVKALIKAWMERKLDERPQRAKIWLANCPRVERDEIQAFCEQIHEHERGCVIEELNHESFAVQHLGCRLTLVISDCAKRKKIK